VEYYFHTHWIGNLSFCASRPFFWGLRPSRLLSLHTNYQNVAVALTSQTNGVQHHLRAFSSLSQPWLSALGTLKFSPILPTLHLSSYGLHFVLRHVSPRGPYVTDPPSIATLNRGLTTTAFAPTASHTAIFMSLSNRPFFGHTGSVVDTGCCPTRSRFAEVSLRVNSWNHTILSTCRRSSVSRSMPKF
jgi:hypothetical protein